MTRGGRREAAELFFVYYGKLMVAVLYCCILILSGGVQTVRCFLRGGTLCRQVENHRSRPITNLAVSNKWHRWTFFWSHFSVCSSKLHHALKAVVGEGFQHGAAGLLSKAGHPVVFTAVLTARLKVHGVGGIHRWIFIKVVVRPQQDPASVAHGNRVGDILSVRDVEEASSHPGYQVLEGTIRPRFSSSSTQLKNIFTRTYIITFYKPRFQCSRCPRWTCWSRRQDSTCRSDCTDCCWWPRSPCA